VAFPAACVDPRELDADTTVVLKCCWVNALSLSIHDGSCLTAPFTPLASAGANSAPSSTNSTRIPPSSRPVALPLRHPAAGAATSRLAPARTPAAAPGSGSGPARWPAAGPQPRNRQQDGRDQLPDPAPDRSCHPGRLRRRGPLRLGSGWTRTRSRRTRTRGLDRFASLAVHPRSPGPGRDGDPGGTIPRSGIPADARSAQSQRAQRAQPSSRTGCLMHDQRQKSRWPIAIEHEAIWFETTAAPCRRLYLGGNSTTIDCDGRLGTVHARQQHGTKRVTNRAATGSWSGDGTGMRRRATRRLL
jgi:hypothetical protein